MKLLISDLDGTLLEADHSVSEGTLKLVEKIRGLGIKFSIATGRALSAASIYIQQLKITVPVILFNGARLYDPVERRYLVEHSLSQRAVELATELVIMHRDLTAAFFVNEEVYAYNVGLNAATYAIRDALVYKSIDDVESIKKKKITKIVFASYPFNLSRLEIELPQLFGPEADVVRSEDDLLEILPKSVNKGSALKELCKLMKISASEVIAMGDSMNDLEMIKVAGIGIAVGKAEDELKKNAKLYIDKTGREALEKVYELLRWG
ncbi:MAG: Cof-type HAD-IIB family hydrolase [Pseudothermotoga sp.]